MTALSGPATMMCLFIVRRILRKYGYPPDKQEQAIQLIMTQTANLTDDWAQE